MLLFTSKYQNPHRNTRKLVKYRKHRQRNNILIKYMNKVIFGEKYSNLCL